MIAVCASACALAVTVTVTGTDSHPVSMAALQAAVVGVPCAVGLMRRRAGVGGRFWRLLAVSGVGLAVVALSGSHARVPYSVGRTAVWFVEPMLIILVLA